MNFTQGKNERYAVFEHQDGNLEIHKDGIVWKGAKEPWQDVLGMCEPNLSAYAEVPLEFLEAQDRPGDTNVPAIVRGDYVHFWIAEPPKLGERRRIGRLFFDQEGVVIKVERDAKRETWDQFKTRVTRSPPTP